MLGPTGQTASAAGNYHKFRGQRQFFSCYNVGSDGLWGIIEKKKGWRSTLRTPQSIRARYSDGETVYMLN